jgi:hypothetical protein
VEVPSISGGSGSSSSSGGGGSGSNSSSGGGGSSSSGGGSSGSSGSNITPLIPLDETSSKSDAAFYIYWCFLFCCNNKYFSTSITIKNRLDATITRGTHSV